MSETELESETKRLERRLKRNKSELIDFQETPQEQIDALQVTHNIEQPVIE